MYQAYGTQPAPVVGQAIPQPAAYQQPQQQFAYPAQQGYPAQQPQYPQGAYVVGQPINQQPEVVVIYDDGRRRKRAVWWVAFSVSFVITSIIMWVVLNN